MSDTAVALHLDEDNPWPGLAQYTEAWRDYFHGRDREVADVLRMVRLSHFVLLYGKSGLGKSSMMQAGAFPVLRAKRFLPVYLRLNYADGTDPPLQQALAQLMKTITEVGLDAPTPGPEETLWAYLQRRERPIWTADNFPLTPVLVFDQFEEVFSHGGSPEHVKQVLDDIADLVGNRLPSALADDAGAAERLNLQTQQYRVVLSFRSDFLDKVASWQRQASLPQPEALDLHPMSRAVAIEAVQKAGDTVLEPGVAEKIVDFVLDRDNRVDRVDRGGADEVEPVLLSLCCFQLNNRRRRPARIDEKLVKEAAQDIMLDFYTASLAGTEPRVAIFIEDNLIQGDRYRSSFPRDEALASGAVTSDELELLQRRRLLRVDSLGGVPRIELIHDRLVGIVHDAREVRRAGERAEAERKAAARQAEEARRDAALAQAQREADIVRRSRNWLFAVVGLLLLSVVSLGYFYIQSINRLDLAKENERLADTWLDMAKENARRADVLRLGVESQAMLAGSKAGGDERAFQQLLAAQLLGPDPQTAALTFESLVSRQHLARFAPLEVKTGSDPTALAFSSNGRLLAVGHADGSVSLRDAADPGRPIAKATGHSDLIQGVSISRDGTRIVSASNDGTLRRWQVQPLRPEGKPMRGHEGAVYGVAMSPDGRRIASAGSDGTVRLWDAASGAELARASPMPPTGLFGVAFNPIDGATLAVVTDEFETTSSLFVLDAATLAISLRRYAHSGSAFALAYSPSGRHIVTAGQDDVVRVHDLRGERPAIVGMGSHGGGDLQAVAFSRDGQWVAAGSRDGTVRLWTAATGEPLGLPLTGHRGGVASVVFSPGGDMLASGAADGTMRLWPLDLSWTMRNGGAKPDGARAVAIGRDGARAVFGLVSGALSLRDEGRQLRTLPLSGGSAAPGAALADCRPDTAPAPRRSLPSRGQNVPQPASGVQAAGVVVLLADGITALSGHEDGTLRRWDLEAGAPIGNPMRASECALTALAASPDGERIAVADVKGTVRLLDGTGKLLVTHASGARVSALALTSEGRQLAVGGTEPPSLKLYVAGQSQPEPMSGVLEAPSSLAFGPGDAVLVSGDARGKLRLWDVKNRRPLTAPLAAGREAVRTLQSAGDGKRFYSASLDGAARPWPAPATWTELMCKKLSANPSRKAWNESVSTELPYRCPCPTLRIEPDDPTAPPAEPLVCPTSG